VIDRLLPTLFLISCGFILCLLCIAVYCTIAAVDNRRAARNAERAARPHSAPAGTAAHEAAAITRARLDEEQR
jgi:hypothetical protein